MSFEAEVYFRQGEARGYRPSSKDVRTKRMKYSEYKTWYADLRTVPDTYDKKKKTVEVEIPDGYLEQFEDFNNDAWRHTLNGMKLVGFAIYVEYLGSGRWGVRAYEQTPILSEDWKIYIPGLPEALYEQRSMFPICGVGFAARDAAIKKARELAATGLYTA